MAANKIYLQVDFQSQGADAAIDTLNKKILGIGAASEAASKQSEHAIEGFQASIEESASSIDKLAEGIAGVGLVELVKHLIEVGDELNNVKAGIEAMTGSLEGFERLRTIARSTGFDLSKLAEGMQNLVSVGMTAGQAGAQLQILVDQAAKVGKSADTVVTVTQKIQQMYASNKVSQRDFATFAELGITSMDKLKDKTHQTAQQIKADMELMNPAAFMQRMNEAMKASSAGEGAKGPGVLTGAAFGQLHVKVVELAEAVEEALSPTLIKAAQLLGDMVDRVTEVVRVFGRLPEWVKDAAAALVFLAVGVKAVAGAFALWKALPGVVDFLTKLGPIARGAWQSMVTLVEGTSAGFTTIGTAAATATAEVEAFNIALKQSLIGLAAAGAAYIAYRYMEEREDTSDEQIMTNRLMMEKHQKRIAEAQKMEAELQGKGMKGVGYAAQADKGTRQRSIMGMSDEELDAYIQKLQDMGAKRVALYNANEAKIKEAEDKAQKFRAEAIERYLKVGQESIAALTYAYVDHFREVEISAKATHDTLIALEYDIAAETKKHLEDVRKAREKSIVDNAALQRKAQYAQLEAIPGEDTQQSRIDLAEAQYQQRIGDFRSEANEAIRLDQVLTDKQIQGIKDAAAAAEKYAKTPAERLQLEQTAQSNIDAWRKAHQDQIDTQEGIYQNKKYEARTQADKVYLAAAYQREKELRDQITQYNIAAISAARDLQVQAIEAGGAQTVAARLRQIQEVRDVSIQALQDIQKQQESNAEESRRQFELAARSSGLLSEDQIAGRLADYDRKAQHERELQAMENATHVEQIRLDAWRQTNEIMIEEQREVYGKLQDLAGQLFDAFTQKSKSVWAAIGDVFKNTMMSAIKSVVTSQMAAALTGILGYGAVTMTAGPLGTRVPVFPGAGPMPSIQLPSTKGAASSNIGYGDIVGSVIDKNTQPLVVAANAHVGAANALVAAANALTSAAAAGGASSAAVGEASRVINDAAGTTSSASGAISAASSSGGGGAWETFMPGPTGTGSITPITTGDYAAGGGPVPLGAGLPNYVPASTIAGQGIGSLPSVLSGIGSSSGGVSPTAATGGTGLSRILSNPKAMGFLQSMAATVGLGMFTSSLSKRGFVAGAQGILGGAMAGWGLAKMFGQNPISGASAGAGLGLLSAGWKRGGASGLLMDVGGGALAGVGIGSMIGMAVGGPLGFAAGAVIGGIVGAGVGIGVGIARLFIDTKDEQVRKLVRQAYGVDLADAKLRQQIIDLANQKYGGDLRMAVYSTDVQDMIRLYAMTTGQSQGGLPRPMYSATFAQSAAGGMQLQPVYSGGQLVANPYTGTTTTQVAQALSNRATYVQLNPQQAVSLFQGQVVQAIGDNPGAVSDANTTAARSGQGRQAQTAAFLEPATVLR